MKKYLIALSAFTIIAIGANAQSPITPRKPRQINRIQKCTRMGKAGYRMNRHRGNFSMMKEINLTDAQKQQAKSLNRGI